MALVGNGVRLGCSNPMRVLYGAGMYTICRAEWAKPGAMRNAFTGASWEAKSGIPDGYRHPGAWLQPQTAGGLAARFEIAGSGSVSAANLAGGLYGESSIAGAGSIAAAATMLGVIAAALAGNSDLSSDATGALALSAALLGTGDVSGALNSVLSAEATLAGTGSLAAAIAGVLDAAATLAGVGSVTSDITGAINASAVLVGTSTLNASVVGAWYMAASLAGSSGVTAAMTAIGHIVADLIGTGTVVAGVQAPASIEATISTAETLSPSNLAAAVWNALVIQYQSAGSFGEAIANGAAGLTQQQIRDAMTLGTVEVPASGSVDELLLSISSPDNAAIAAAVWDEPLSGHTNPGTTGDALQNLDSPISSVEGITPTQAAMLLEIYQILGLDPTKPLVVTQTQRRVGDGTTLEQTIQNNGGTVVVTRR